MGPDQIDLGMLRQVLHFIGKRELKRWGAGRYKDSVLAGRLAGLGRAGQVSRILGHRRPELFACWNRSCPGCRTRRIKQKAGDAGIEVDPHYHTVVVAQGALSSSTSSRFFLARASRPRPIGSPCDCEVYGKAIGTLVADAQGEPFRREARKAGYHFVIRHKKGQIEPGKRLHRDLDRRDPERARSDHRDARTERRRNYECWEEADPLLGCPPQGGPQPQGAGGASSRFSPRKGRHRRGDDDGNEVVDGIRIS